MSVMHGIAVLGAYTNLLWFLYGSPSTGPFVVMLYEVVALDVRVFALIAGVFLCGFSVALVAFDDRGPRSVDMLLQRAFEFAYLTVGEIDARNYETSSRPLLVNVLVLLYASVILIVLLNLLIARMGDTYNRIARNSERRWLLERYRIIQRIQSDLGIENRRGHPGRYWVVVEGKPYLQVEERNGDYYRASDDEAR